jgi:sugar/nucleoside kinase (ribokinase family)
MDAAVFGLIVADLIAQPMDVRHPPPPGGLHQIDSLSLACGGNVCNVATAMAKLGLRVGAAGLVGKDILGEAVVDRLNDAGVDTGAVFATERAQTSATVVAVEPGGERCFFHTPGATRLINADVFRHCVPIFQKVKWLQVGYFGLLPEITPDLPALLGDLRQKAPKLKIALDTVNPPADVELLRPILRHVDLFAPSRVEAEALSGQREPGRMAEVFRRDLRAEATVAIKLDAEGCYLDVAGDDGVVVPSFAIDLVDSTGAGDTWFGALLTGLIKGMEPQRAARFANRAAADCCTALGASAGVQSYEKTLGRI